MLYETIKVEVKESKFLQELASDVRHKLQ